MLADFKNIYDIHRWIRYITWLGLLSAAFFLLLMGGLPPRAWVLLMQVASQHSLASHNQDAAAVVNAGVWSLMWALVWGAFLWGCLALIRHHRTLYLLKLEQSGMGWMSSQNVSLALSTSGGYTAMDEKLAMAIPRLRLPQKLQQVTKPVTYSKRSSHPAPESYLPPIHDIPTRPAGSTYTKKTRQLCTQPLSVGIGWNPGIARRQRPNEDGLLVLQTTCTYYNQLVPFALFVVADGMGGHEDGQEASRIAVQCMMHTVLQNIMMGKDLNDDFLADMLIGGVVWANLAIYQRALAEGKDMGTTVTAALVIGMKAYIVNVGDSRTYLFREGDGLQQITRDHSLVASLVVLGQIKPEEVYTHPERNKVYRSLGNNEDLKVDCFTIALHAYDRLLLCSDGLWEMVRDPQLERLLRSSDDLTFVSDAMVQAALRGGGDDNVSAIVVQVPYV